MTGIERLWRDPVSLGFWTFTLALVLKAFHQLEHVARIFERHVLDWPIVRGILGAAFSYEIVHFAYHSTVTVLLAAALAVYVRNPGIWRKSSPSLFALVFSWLSQGYLLVAFAVTALGPARAVRVPQSVTAEGSSIEIGFLWNSVIVMALLVAYAGFHPSPTRAYASTPLLDNGG